MPDCWAERTVLSTLTGERKRQSWSPRTGGPGTDGGLRVQGGVLGEARARPVPDPVTGWEEHKDPVRCGMRLSSVRSEELGPAGVSGVWGTAHGEIDGGAGLGRGL